MPRPGPLRPLLNVRVCTEDTERLKQRAERETGGNLSELLRRMIKYAETRMPPGWDA